jgi:hypothetical protein
MATCLKSLLSDCQILAIVEEVTDGTELHSKTGRPRDVARGQLHGNAVAHVLLGYSLTGRLSGDSIFTNLCGVTRRSIRPSLNSPRMPTNSDRHRNC